MSVLVIGSTGPIGRAICAELSARGIETIATSRTGGKVGDHHVKVDRTDTGSMVSIIRDLKPQTVVDVIAMTHAKTAPLLDGLRGLIDCYVLISSSDVYRNYGLLIRQEVGDPILTPVAENGELRSSRYPYRGATPRSAASPDSWMDDYDKIPVEQAVRDSGIDWIILRLPMVYGPGDPQRRFGWALSPMLSNKPCIRVPPAWARWKTTYGYIGNVASAVVHAAIHPDARCEIFNVVDFEPVNHIQWMQRLREATGWTGVIEQVEDPDSVLAETVRNLDLQAPLLIDGAKLKSRLGFTPPVDIDTALRRLVAAS